MEDKQKKEEDVEGSILMELRKPEVSLHPPN